MIVPVMAISNLVLTQQIYSEETNGAQAHNRARVPLNLFLWFRRNYSRNWECFDQSCVNETETLYGTFNCVSCIYLSYIVWSVCENLHDELVYFKELHNDQEYYWPAIYRARAAVVSTIASIYQAWAVVLFGC